MPTLSIDIRARLAEFQDGLGRVESDTKRMVSGVDSAFSGLRKTIGLLAGAGVLSQVISGIRDTADELDGLAKAAQGAGVTVESLSALRYAAELSGLQLKDMDKVLAVLSKRLSDAAVGTGDAAKAFDALKIDPKQFSSADDALKAIAEKFATLPDGVTKTALASKIFGDELGARLVPLLNAGASGIAAMTDEAGSLGRVFSTELAKDAEAFNDELTRMSSELNAITVQLAGPVISNLAKLMALYRANKAEAGDTVEGLLETFRSINPDIFDFTRTPFTTVSLTDYDKRVAELSVSLKEAQDSAAKFREKIESVGDKPSASSSRFIKTWERGLEKANADAATLQDKIAKINRVSLREFQGFAPNGEPVEKVKPPVIKAATEKISEGQRLVDQLNSRLNATRDLTAAQQLEIDIFQKRIALTPSEGKAARAIAVEIDARQELATTLQTEVEMRKLIDSAEEKEVQRQSQVQTAMLASVEAMKDLEDPTRAFHRAITEVQEALAKGLISDDVADANIRSIADAALKFFELNDKVKETKSVFSELQFSFESGFESAIFGGEKLSNVFKELLIDMAKLVIRQKLLKPLFEGLLTLGDKTPGQTPGQAGIASVLGAVTTQASGLTVNVQSGVSQAMTAAAVSRGMAASNATILDSSVRGGAYYG